MICDESCDCPLKETCLGRRFPDLFGTIFREHWESGNPVLRQHVINRAAIGYTPPEVTPSPPPPDHLRVDPPPPEYPPQWPPAPAPSIQSLPLAGDLLAAMTAKIGADRLARWVAKKMGTNDCGCASRQAALNKMDAAARRYLKRLGGGHDN